MTPATISGSSIQDFQNDRLRWCFRWISNRVPLVIPQALRTGTAVHQAFEAHFKTGAPLDACLVDVINAVPEVGLTKEEEKSLAELKGLVEPLAFWKSAFPIDEILSVEERFELEVPNANEMIFQGTPDMAFISMGKVWHMQHKTIGSGVPVGVFIDGARHSLHELIYGKYLEEKFNFYKYGGTVYNLVRKLKYRYAPRTKEEKKEGKGKIRYTPEAMFSQHPIAIDRKLQDHAWCEVSVIANEMRKIAELYNMGALIPRNHKLDTGYFGNKMCPYMPVIEGKTTLDDPTLYQDREDRYANVLVQ